MIIFIFYHKFQLNKNVIFFFFKFSKRGDQGGNFFIRVQLIYILRAYINYLFWKIFYGKLKKLLKKISNLFLFFHKSFLKWFTNVCSTTSEIVYFTHFYTHGLHTTYAQKVTILQLFQFTILVQKIECVCALGM